MAAVAELQEGRKLLHVVERWLRAEKEGRQQRVREGTAAGGAVAASQQQQQQRQQPFFPSRQMAFYR